MTLSACQEEERVFIEGHEVARHLQAVIEQGNFYRIGIQDDGFESCYGTALSNTDIKEVRFDGFYITFGNRTYNLNKLIGYCDDQGTLVLDFG